jgi:hypothetical protein
VQGQEYNPTGCVEAASGSNATPSARVSHNRWTLRGTRQRAMVLAIGGDWRDGDATGRVRMRSHWNMKYELGVMLTVEEQILDPPCGL